MIFHTPLSPLKITITAWSSAMIAFTWAYIIGIYRHEHLKEIKILKHGRKAKSFFKYGLDFIVQALMNPKKSKDFQIALKILSCTMISSGGNIF